MSKEFEIFSEEFERCRSLIYGRSILKEANNLTNIKKGRYYVEKIKSYCLERIDSLYKKVDNGLSVRVQIEQLNVEFNFGFSQVLEEFPQDSVFVLEKSLIIFYLSEYLKENNISLYRELFKNLLMNNRLTESLFKTILLCFLNSQFFEDCVIHEITHVLQFNSFDNNVADFSKKQNKEYSKNMYEFYAVKADLFNRCCREFEKEGLTNFSFDQLKNKMSKQGNGNYYKMLINFKGIDFFNRQLMKDYESYIRFGLLLESRLFSEEYFNKLKELCSTEEERKRVDDPEWRKWFIEATLKSSVV